jgi:hypothetical protein
MTRKADFNAEEWRKEAALDEIAATVGAGSG